MMRALRIFVIINLLIASNYSGYCSETVTQYADASCVTVTTAVNGAVNLEFQPTSIDLQSVEIDGNYSDLPVVPYEGLIYEYGNPILPSVSRFIVVPPNTGLTLQIESGEPEVVPLDHEPAICNDPQMVPSLAFSCHSHEGGNPLNSVSHSHEGGNPLNSVSHSREGGNPQTGCASLDNPGLFPPVIAEMSEPFIIRGVRLVKITTYPVRYDPSQNAYLCYRHITADVIPDDTEPVNPVLQPVRKHRSQEFIKFIRALAANGEIVGRDDPDAVAPYVGHYLVAIQQNCLEYVAPFIEWRRKSGYKVDILRLTTNEALNENTVKNLIQERYDSYVDDGLDPFEYLMLVGDRSSYNQGGNQENGNWILESFNGNTIWSFRARHADYLFGCLDGNDHYPDVALARWPSGDANRLNIATNRTLAYEAEPYMEETDWFTRGGVFSQHWGNGEQTAWHITIHTNVRWGEEVLKSLGFDEVRFYERYEWDRDGQAIGPFERDLFNDGSNLHIGRAENYYWRYNFNNVTENVVFPIRLVVSGHGEWPAENAFRTNINNRDLMGTVAGTCGWGGPATAPNSAVWMHLVRSHLLEDMPFGWARTFSVIDFERYFTDFQWSGQPLYRQVKSDIDAYGDPAIQYWKGVPQVVVADHPESISPQSTLLEVLVFDEETEEPVEGGRVTLYQPNNMPAFNNNNYATYDEMKMWTTTTEADGIARFVLDPEDLTPGEMKVTVTGRTLKPYHSELEVETPPERIELDDYSFEEVEGNGDNLLNPGESIDLLLTAANVGDDNTLNNVTATISSLSPWIEVADNTVSFGNIQPDETAEADERIRISLSPSCPDGHSRPATKPRLIVHFLADENRNYESAIELNPSAPNFEINLVVGGIVINGYVGNKNIEIKNIGSMDSPAISAMLATNGFGISVLNGGVNYPSIRADRTARIDGNLLELSLIDLAVPGSFCDMMMIFETEDGFIDTAEFVFQCGTTREGAPTGPDNYGYICFDDTDTDWEIAPEYEWLEISMDEPNRDYNGTECNFDGQEQFDTGEAQVVNLGFTTQFYGREYNQITISTNGFIAMGSQPRITNLQNWPMDAAIGGGVGMIAPFWDHLRFQQTSGVYYYRDVDEGAFIVEWYKLRHHDGGNSDLNFQVILYDRDRWQTATGDQNIIFQYKNISNIAGLNNEATDMGYASVGISSPDGTTGINYTFKNQYPVSAEPLQNQRALLFATSPDFKSGDLYGRVVNAENNDPIAGVLIFTEHGYNTITDENGTWEILDALAEIPFVISARKEGFNDSTLTDLVLEENDRMEINFALLHPEFVPLADNFRTILNVDMSAQQDLTIRNDGNGPLSWSVQKSLLDDINAEPWELRRSYYFGDSVDDARINGVAFIDGEFYCPGSGNDINYVYVFDRDGNEIRRFEQFLPEEQSQYGMNDLAWDGELLWGADNTLGTVFGFTLEGELITTFATAFRPIKAITWDSENELLWMTGSRTDLLAYNRNGQLQARLNIVNLGFRIAGLSYWTEDSDGYKLYIQHDVSNQDVEEKVYKMDVDNLDTLFVADLFPPEGGTPHGNFISNQFDAYSWVMFGVANQGAHDRVDVWQLNARKDWFRIVPNGNGTINAGNSQNYTMTLDAAGLPAALFEGFFSFHHNADGGRFDLPVRLEVQVGPGAPAERELSLKPGWNMVSLNIEPDETDIPTLFEPLVRVNNLKLVKDGVGRFYSPEADFNNIPQWNTVDGYQVFVSDEVTMDVPGVVIAQDEPIQLTQGWNLNAYFPLVGQDPVYALQGIAEQLIIVKNGRGEFYYPQFNYSNLSLMIPGQGYMIKVLEDIELVYSIEQDRIATEIPLSMYDTPVHFTYSSKNELNMSMLVLANAKFSGYELGAFNSIGQLIGSGKFDHLGSCGMAIWGDLITENEPFHIRIWDGSTESDCALELIQGDLKWKNDGITVASVSGSGKIPVKFELSQVYPNPANGPVLISYGLESAGFTSIKVFDVAGREIDVINSGHQNAGYHRMAWNSDKVASGVYLVRLEAGEKLQAQKIAVIK